MTDRTDSTAHIDAAILASIQPVVLVGGKSTRFGRDKLREPWGDDGRVLVQRPIDALRDVFGRRVLLVGECHPSIVPLADGVIRDLHPGVGPMGGVISALEHGRAPVFVAAGDMPGIDAATIRALLTALVESPGALAVFAADDRPHPALAIYCPESLATLRDRLARGERALHSALPREAVVLVPCDQRVLANVNSQSDLR